ncbi:MAG: hypothetical protein KAZ68_03180, partial [Candidatus Methylopumilus sp.]|nr:hypothetical protein [Candidatus Methylopumilus sp.]
SVGVDYLVFRSLVFLCGGITRFGRPATGENLTTYRFIEKVFKATDLKAEISDFERYEVLEEKIQLAVSGIEVSTFFEMLKTRLLPTQTLHQIMIERDMQTKQIQQLNKRIVELQNSTSWRITWPLRYASDWAHKIFSS